MYRSLTSANMIIANPVAVPDKKPSPSFYIYKKSIIAEGGKCAPSTHISFLDLQPAASMLP
jgi:hypothetical protein